MSEPAKIYAPVSAKEVTFQSGKSILKLGINVAKFKAWLDEHQNEKGYANVGVSARKEVSQYGETHTVWLDTWRPTTNQQARTSGGEKPLTKSEYPTTPHDDSDNVPF